MPKNNFPVDNLNIVFFDGFCILCSKFINFLLKKDKNKRLYYASQQSGFGKKIIKKFLSENGNDAVVFIKSGKVYIKSSAVIRILGELGVSWKISLALFIIPPFLRNLIYDWIAKKRYSWFGKSDSCYLPQPEFKNHFLDYFPFL